jgi:cystathionine beta-synthase
VVIFHDHGTRYLGKMFNDDWMRDRGFLVKEKPKAIDLIEGHKHEKLVTLNADQSVLDAVTKMSKYNISQIPVIKNGQFAGSISDSHLFSKMVDTPDLKDKKIESVMQAPFPFVDANTSMEEISKKINRENSAVLVKDSSGKVHIITKHDIIQAIG